MATNTEEVQQQGLALAKLYFETKARRDQAAEDALFTDDVVHLIPLNPSGTPAPWFEYKGKKEVTDYQHQVLTNFSRLHMVDPVYTVSADGLTVFMEAHGDYIYVKGDKPYRNVYIFKLVIRDGLLAHITEYANPVTYAKLAGFPIG